MKRLAILFFTVILLMGCRDRFRHSSETKVLYVTDNITEIYYFHSKQRCITCNAIEKLTKEVADSLGSERVIMHTVDISYEGNKALVDKYEVNWSSLFVVKQDKSENITGMAFTHAKGSPQTFKQKLVEEIEKMEQ